MLHKQIIAALLLSCIFVLGNSLDVIACSKEQREQQEAKNLCSNLTYSIGCLCLEDGGGINSYMFEFQSSEICEGVHKELTKQNVFCGVKECPTKQLGCPINSAQLEMVCQADEIVEALYQKERDLCVFEQASGRRCHNLECVTELLPTNVCDNLTLVEEIFDMLKRREEPFNETQKYIVIFKEISQCEKTARKIRRNRLPKRLENATSTLCSENCTGGEKYLSATLDLEALEWVCKRRQLGRVIFEEKYINDSICRNVTKAERLFFPSDTKFENFTVVYNATPNASVDCKSLVDELTNPTRPNISAIINIKNCTQSTPQIGARLNYEALILVCSYTDPTEATVTAQVRESIQPAEESTEEPTVITQIGISKGGGD